MVKFSRTFSLDDQRAFAGLSGDWNPLHVDPIYARRSMFGHVVVHGIHAALWAVDSFLSRHGKAFVVETFNAQFLRAIPADMTVTCVMDEAGSGRVAIEVHCQGSVAATLTLTESAGLRPHADAPPPGIPGRAMVRELSIEELAGLEGGVPLHLDEQAAAAMFPSAAALLPPGQFAAIMATSRLAGMECPGLHSLLFEVHLGRKDGPASPVLAYRAVRVDKRFRQIELAVSAPGLAGAVTAFVRKPPQQQKGFLDIRRLVTAGEFEGQRSLVIGGSRGLGEVVAKLLAAGGAEVVVSYHQGRDDAARVAAEISDGGGKASHCRFDVLDPGTTDLPHDWRPSHLYYFATNSYLAGANQTFSSELFRTFCAYHVEGFGRAFEMFRERGLRCVFYPSSVAIDEIPQGMTEYAAAKAAAEILCGSIQRSNPEVAVVWPRLPRMATDQTVGLLPVRADEPAPLMLDLLRSARGALN